MRKMFSLMMTMSRNRSYVEFGHISHVHRCTKGTCNDLHLIPIQRCTCQNTYNWKWIRKSQKSCSSEEGSCGHSSLSGKQGVALKHFFLAFCLG
ncbi:uncharacterized protein LOC109123950 isoform X2 [Vitis vinifera]|uniref:uncharacterized protein LOC109123950 isoform X2 n=1 Tax=Vitis vinifera TaxID=29760 RepID=UPI002882F571|nr:uncharacterized protein LOC109123950 isoform X2 [Vitis vinifera]